MSWGQAVKIGVGITVIMCINNDSLYQYIFNCYRARIHAEV